MRSCDLKEVTGKELKKWYKWLVHEKEGCCSVHFASTEKYRYCVCMGWHHYNDEQVLDEHGKPVYEVHRWNTKNTVEEVRLPKFKPVWKIAWKIGRQTHNNVMQCDLDVDFEMPYVTEAMAKANPKLCEGNVDDTCEEVFADNRPGIIGGWTSPVGFRSWDDFAKYVRKTARRVWRDWRDHDE